MQPLTFLALAAPALIQAIALPQDPVPDGPGVGLTLVDRDFGIACGGKTACTGAGCIIEISGIAGCNGQTDYFAGICGNLHETVDGLDSFTREICGSAHVTVHQGRSPVTIEFENSVGEKFWCAPDDSGCETMISGPAP